MKKLILALVLGLSLSTAQANEEGLDTETCLQYVDAIVFVQTYRSAFPSSRVVTMLNKRYLNGQYQLLGELGLEAAIHMVYNKVPSYMNAEAVRELFEPTCGGI